MTPDSQLDEFRWENEIRRHENQVADFFHDLVYCLDLPTGELPAPPGITGLPVPADSVTPSGKEAYWQWMAEHEDDAEENDDYEPRHPVCFSCVDSLDQLAVMWNKFTVNCSCGKEFALALGINCAFGKLLARCADFTEPAEKICSDTLLISLGKRTIADLENLVLRLDHFQYLHPEKKDVFTFFRTRLAIVRDQLTGKLAELRNRNA